MKFLVLGMLFITNAFGFSSNQKVLQVSVLSTGSGNTTAVTFPGLANGLVCFLDVTAATALTSLDVKLQHSSDNSYFEDLASFAFTQVTASPAQEYMQPAVAARPVEAVLPYVRANYTLVGTNVTWSLVCNFQVGR